MPRPSPLPRGWWVGWGAPMTEARALHPALARYHDGPPSNPRSYPDLHEHILALARENLLVVVDEPINKDTEMHPLVRWQYRGGIPEPERKAFLFTQPTDSKGRRFDCAVLVAGLAANRDVYRIGFGKSLEDIGRIWIKAIADILASCVNTNGTVSGPTNPTACYTLLTNALSGGTTGTQPTDTATAAINIAHNPGANIAALYALSTATPPFAPALAAQPFDFTVALSFTGGGLNEPFSIAVDGSGNVWTANQGHNSVSQINGVTGAAISPAGGYTGNGLTKPFSVAIDPAGNAWVLNMYLSTPPSNVSVFTPAGAVFTGSPFSGGGLATGNSLNATSPRDVAFDANGNAWFANLSTGTATELNGLTGAAISPSTGYPISTTVNSQSGVAVDSAGHVWISGMNGNVLYEMAVSNGALLGASAYTAGGLEQPYSIAIDASNNSWLPNNYDPNTLVGNTVSKFTSV